MHIGMVVCEFPPRCGGQGYYVYNLSKRLIRKGHQVTIITRGSWHKTYREEMDGISVYRAQFMPSYPFHLQLHGISVNRLLRQLSHNFDMVHLHNPNIPVINTSLPTVVTEHGIAKSHIDHFQSLDLHSLALKIFAKIYISIDRKVLSSAREVIAVSRSCADELQAFYGITNVTVVSSGVDSGFFCQPEAEYKGKPYVLYTGALTTRKGLVDLIKGAQYVCRDYPEVNFIITGTGPLGKYLKKLAHDLNLDNRISFVGYVSREQLLRYYQESAVYVLPSYYEGMPATLLEAMSCGVPTVTTAVSGNSEVIIDGETGFLVPPQNPGKLADAILTILNDKELGREMGNNARKRVEDYFDWDIIAGSIENIYQSVI